MVILEHLVSPVLSVILNETAIELRDLLQKYGLSCDEENTGGEKYQFFVSDQTEKFTAFATSILPNDVKETRKVDIEKY